jgi:hypothetical protein
MAEAEEVETRFASGIAGSANATPDKPGAQLLDNRMLKQSPPDLPSDPGQPQPPGGWSGDPAMRAAQEIA